MDSAYTDAAGRPSPDFSEPGTGNLGGLTLVPGLYKWTNNVTIPTNITIAGGPNDVWIFQISGNLTMSSAVKITLSGGAQASNIFWQVAGEATLGTTAQFEGIIFVYDRHYFSNRCFDGWSGSRTDCRHFRCQRHYRTLTKEDINHHRGPS
jgi:hypothetical protein